MSDRPQHAPIWGFESKGNELLVGGVGIVELAAEVGSTPFFAYDRRLIQQRVDELRAALPEVVHLHYAVKANPMPKVVNLLAGLVDGLDVASRGEMELALASDMSPPFISFAGPGKTDDELEAALVGGVTVNVESLGEITRLANWSEKLELPAQVAVRVNPDFELKSAGMRMGGGSKPFGIDTETVPEALDRISRLGVKFRGFHIYWGSQNLRAEAIVEAQEKAVDLAIELAKKAPAPPEIVNIGGGFGIPYFPGERHLDLEPIGEGLQRLAGRAEKAMPGAKLIIELGRFLVGEAGVYISRVIDKKVSRGRTYLITDGGLHHQLAASGNFGQVIRKNYPVAVANRMNWVGKTEEVSIVGRLCTPLDILGDRMELPAAEVGDLVAVFQSGAYGLTASPTAFLSHPAPKEVLV